ncbi:YLP motif-containing protein 1 isoform X2 [Dunckerocampus dactyliophorus]|uniref:YLP motif-containing protein 1 isoform X2 n=1 Tax=Dunckerocampus dactyliophorus TaxID=161453 RepID=UPI002406662D|nr:YLP motif-containing protein 1 isoform X2 [Dunckerocampus dactyliophorus]
MYPSWGNFGAPPSQNYGGSGPRNMSGGGLAGPQARFGGLQASPSGTLFSSLQEQHLQQMQQLQMLHQKQLQTVLHHGSTAPPYGGGHQGGYSGSSWQSTEPVNLDSGMGTHSLIKGGDTLSTQPDPSKQPPPTQTHAAEAQPAPPPPEPQSSKVTEPNAATDGKTQDAFNKDDKTLPLQNQQQLWYQQHLQNLHKLRQEKRNQKDGNFAMPQPAPPNGQAVQPPPPSETPTGAPLPPLPKEEPPAPPPPPEPDSKQDVEETARLQQLQAAAAQWQQVQQQRVGLHYQALMQQHEKLQQILEKYQPLIQQPPNLQTMSPEMQLRHYETQKQQFTPLYQDWEVSFRMWFEQFQTYPHKDQLHDYEHQWKQWQDQMNATNAHLLERITTLTTMVPYAANQYNNVVIGQYGAYTGQDMQMQPQQVNPGMQFNAVTAGPALQGQPPTPAAAPLHTGGPPAGVGLSGHPSVPSPNFNNIGGPRGNNPGFHQPHMPFDGPPRFDQQTQRFDRPHPLPQPQQRCDAPPQFDQHPQRFDGPPRFDQPHQRFDGPPRFNQPGSRFEAPPRFDQPIQHFDGPPRFDQQPRANPPRFGRSSRFDQPPKQTGPPVPSKKQQETPPQVEQTLKPPPSVDSSLKSVKLPQSDQQNSKSEFSTTDKDMMDDMVEGENFFIPSDPIPQTKMQEETNDSSNIPDSSPKPKPLDSKPAQLASTTLESKQTNAPNVPKPEGLLTNNNPPVVPEKKTEKQLSKTDPVRPPPGTGHCQPLLLVQGRGRGQPPVPMQGTGRGQPPVPVQGTGRGQPPVPVQGTGRGQPPVPVQGTGRGQPPVPVQGTGRGQHPSPVQGRGRGKEQRGHGDFRGQNFVPPEGQIDEMLHDFMPPEEEEFMQEQEEDFQWQDPSVEEFGGETFEAPDEEMWIPEDHHFQTEEKYYEGPLQGPPLGRGGFPMMRGRPPIARGGGPMGRGVPPLGRGGPFIGRGGPPMGRGGPPMGRGGPPMGRGGPPMGRGGPPMGRGGPPMGRGGPPMVRGGPPMGRGGPPMGRGGPPMGRGGPPMGGGEPMDDQWEETETEEYYNEEDAYWGEGRPPMRGMRPPFPSGHRRPPRGCPGFMHQGRGPPPHLAHGPIDEESFGHETGDMEMVPSEHYMYGGHDPHNLPMHPARGRGRRPPPPHEAMGPDGEPFYHEEMENEQDWLPPHGRRPPMPHEIMERGGMGRRPMGRGMARGMMRPGSSHEHEEVYSEVNVENYVHGEDRWRSLHPDDPRHEARFYDSEWDTERPPPERDFSPRLPPLEHFREDRWLDDRERVHPYPYDDEYDRRRGEIRIREYPDEPPSRPEDPSQRPPEWDRPSRHPPSERLYPSYGDHRDEPRLDRPPLSEPAENLPESSIDLAAQGAGGGNVLALSQRQHEIILKAAQELKRIREIQEGKPVETESQPAPADILPDLPAGLLGLEIPPEVRNALKGMTTAAQTAPSWDTNPAALAPAVIPKTVDYGHGHDTGLTVERIAYGERVVLRPDPDRGYEKEPLRDPYSRDPYYDRRSDPYMDRREYSRERELYREKPPPEYERERFGRERYLPRNRDESTLSMVEERAPLAPPHHSGYRERDRDLRERDRSGSRDREDLYGRPGYDRPLYERTALDCGGSERYGHGSSPFDRRSYPEDRGPPAAPLAPPPQPPPQVEKKPEIKNVDDILKPPGRQSRPERIVVIMRGLPGSGKSHVAKLIRDKEVDCGGAPPRVLVLDDYFMSEVEKVEKDPDTGRRVKRKVLEYEYEPEMEDTYRSSMLKTFKKTLDDGFFPFIILDTINDRVKHFDQFWSAAKTKGFEVYIAEITADTHTCSKRNAHGRSHKDITKMSNNWESTPRHMVRLDVRSLLQDAAIEEVEMEDFNPEDEPKEAKREEEEEGDLGYIPKSKWEMDTSEAKLDKLDGLGSGGKRKREGEHMAGMEDYLQLPDDYATRMSQPGKKRVRWADLEEQKDADRKRAIGFVVGQTDWEKITDDSGLLAQKALNRTKYF